MQSSTNNSRFNNFSWISTNTESGSFLGIGRGYLNILMNVSTRCETRSLHSSALHATMRHAMATTWTRNTLVQKEQCMRGRANKTHVVWLVQDFFLPVHIPERLNADSHQQQIQVLRGSGYCLHTAGQQMQGVQFGPTKAVSNKQLKSYVFKDLPKHTMNFTASTLISVSVVYFTPAAREGVWYNISLYLPLKADSRLEGGTEKRGRPNPSFNSILLPGRIHDLSSLFLGTLFLNLRRGFSILGFALLLALAIFSAAAGAGAGTPAGAGAGAADIPLTLRNALNLEVLGNALCSPCGPLRSHFSGVRGVNEVGEVSPRFKGESLHHHTCGRRGNVSSGKEQQHEKQQRMCFFTPHSLLIGLRLVRAELF